MTHRLLPVLLVLACDPAATSPSTQVGNPGRIAAITGGLSVDWSTATAAVEEWTLLDCDDAEPTVLLTDEVMEFSEASPLTLPAGTSCGTLLRFAGPLVATGSLGGTPFRVDIEPNVINLKLAGPIDHDNQSVFVVLGGPDWVTEDDLQRGVVDENGVVLLDQQSGLRGRLQSNSAIYVDFDGDGVLSEDELVPTIAP